MRNILLCLSLLVPVSSSLADEPLPRDVQRFVDRREGCDHMRGEMPDPGERQRARAMSREIQQLCAGTDHSLAQLKKRYAKNPVVMRHLDEFEPAVEAKAHGVIRKRR